MRRLSALLAATLALILAAQAWATTYTLSNATYTHVSGVYASATGITGSFTTAAPLPAGLNLASIASGTGGLGYVTSWSFSDGVNTFTEANSGPLSNSGGFFSVSTDGAGAVTDMRIDLVSPLFLTASKLVNRITLDFIAATPVAAAIAGIYTCPSGVVGGLCGTFFVTSNIASGVTATFTSSGSPPATVTLLKPQTNRVIAQNVASGLCPSDPTHGSGYGINFRWTMGVKPPNLDHFNLHVQHVGSPVAALDVNLMARRYRLLVCNKPVIDSELANWFWQVTAFDNSGAVLGTSEQRPFSFAPCRLSDGAACAP